MRLKHQMEFMCGVCMVKEMMKLKREIEDLKKKMECMKSIDVERKEAGGLWEEPARWRSLL